MIKEINPIDLKRRLIDYMKKNGIATKTCARLIGISYLSLKRFLHEKGTPYTNTLFKIAHYLDMHENDKKT